MSEEVDRQKDDLLRDFRDLQGSVNMSSLIRTISETSTTIAGLPNRIKTLRDRGYAFAGYLEGKAETLAKQWGAVEADAKSTAQRKAGELSRELDEVEDRVSGMEAAQGLAAKTYISQLEPVINRIKNEVEEAERQIESTFGEVPNNVAQTISQISGIETCLERTEEASFPLNAAEAVFMAVEAEWDDGKDKPDGIFFITDQRIVMEQKEKVGKKFGLFGGEQKHGVLWESPVGAISDVKHENKGFLGGKDMIHLSFGSGGPFANTTIEVKGGIKAEWFAAQLKRASSGGLEKERGLELDEALVDAVVNAPTTCGVCGATFDQEIVAGMTQMKCDYCGSITRLAIK